MKQFYSIFNGIDDWSWENTEKRPACLPSLKKNHLSDCWDWMEGRAEVRILRLPTMKAPVLSSTKALTASSAQGNVTYIIYIMLSCLKHSEIRLAFQLCQFCFQAATLQPRHGKSQCLKQPSPWCCIAVTVKTVKTRLLDFGVILSYSIWSNWFPDVVTFMFRFSASGYVASPGPICWSATRRCFFGFQGWCFFMGCMAEASIETW